MGIAPISRRLRKHLERNDKLAEYAERQVQGDRKHRERPTQKSRLNSFPVAPRTSSRHSSSAAFARRCNSSGDTSGESARHDPGLFAVTMRGDAGVAPAFAGLGAFLGRDFRAVTMLGGLWAMASIAACADSTVNRHALRRSFKYGS
jgi:hypothetical protein